jgi:hypothetical protein
VPPGPDLEVVLVAYRSAPLVERLLTDLPDLPVVVVDNGRGVDGLAQVVARFPRAATSTGRAAGSPSGPTRAPARPPVTSWCS